MRLLAIRVLTVVAVTIAVSSAVANEESPRRIEVTKKESEVILPQDKLALIVTLRGKTFIQEILNVDAEHTIYLPDFGRVSVQGLTPAETSDLITQKYQERLYPTSISTVSYQRVFKNLAVND